MEASVVLTLILGLHLFCLIRSVTALKTNDSTIFSPTPFETNNAPLPPDSKMPPFATSSYQAASSSKRTVITVLASISYSGDMPVGPLATTSIQVALDQLRKQPNWLNNYDLAVELVDDECIDSKTINQILPKLRSQSEAYNQLPVFWSPACDGVGMKTVGEALKFFNYIGVTTVQTSLEPFLQRNRFNTLFPLGPRSDALQEALSVFLAKIGWRKIALISERFPFYDHLDKAFQGYLGKQNITLLWYGKVSHSAITDQKEMNDTFDDMARYDPRIIVANADRGAPKACWLHRYGMYGPNYVIFFAYWSDVYPTSAVPGDLESWCTIEMINEVLASSIIYGEHNLAEAYGYDAPDETGLTNGGLTIALGRMLEDPESNPLWGFWRLLNYDTTLFVGYFLNSTEAALNRRNETLADWVTSSENFKTNPTFLTDLMKDAIYSTSVKGLKGEYHFERSTTVNSKGFTPITFTQMQKTGNVVVARYRSSNGLQILQDRIEWLTHGGNAPRDSVLVVPVEEARVSLSAFTVFTVLGFLAISLSVTLISISAFKLSHRMRLLLEDYGILVGNVVLLTQVFALPFEAHSSINVNCCVMAFSIMMGYSTSMFFLVAKMDNGVREFVQRTRLSARSGTGGPGNDTVKSLAWLLAFFTAFLGVQVSSLSAFFGISPIRTLSLNLTSRISPVDNSILYQSFTYDCQVVFEPLGTLALVAVILVLHLALLLRAIWIGYRIHSNEIHKTSPDIQRACTSFYCTFLIFVAGTCIACLLQSGVFIILPSISLCYAAVTTLLNAVLKVLPNGDSIVPNNIGIDPRQGRSTIGYSGIVKVPCVVSQGD